MGQVMIGQDRLGEVRTGQDRSGEVRTGKGWSGQVKTGKEQTLSPNGVTWEQPQSPKLKISG